MRSRRLVLAVLSTFCLAAVLGATGAVAAQVAYVDGGQVWVSTLDGASKRSLSGPSPDEKTWTETAQAENGTVIGVRREPGKIGTLNATRLWSADGTLIGEGSLTAPSGRTSYAYPVTLGLTPDGKIVTYGYSNWSGFGLGTVYEFGTYAEGSSGWYIQPFDVRGIRSGTLVGSRLVGISNGSTSIVTVQNASGQAPYSEEFTPWLEAGGVERANVSASGTVAAVQLEEGGVKRVAMIPFAALGAPAPSDGSDCFLPAQGNAGEVSISADGSTMAWHDARGVVVAGTPVWFASSAVSTCNLSSPPVVISATGRMPSLGNSTFATPPSSGGGGGGSTGGGSTGGGGQSPPTPAPVKGGGDKNGGQGGTKSDDDAPTVTPLPKTVKASALAGGGLPISVKVAKPGKVTAVGKVGSQVVAKGATKAKRAGKVTLRLKATKAWSKRLAQLTGKTLKVRVTAPGGSTKLGIKLG